MLILIIIFNVLISMVCIYATIKMRRMTKKLRKIARYLRFIDQKKLMILGDITEAIAQHHSQLQLIQSQYQQLTTEMEKMQQIAALINFMLTVYKRWKIS